MLPHLDPISPDPPRLAHGNGRAWTQARPDRPERLLAIDIETVRDRARTPACWPEDKFPKVAFHEVVAISYATARIVRHEDGTESYVFERCQSGGEPGWSEAELVRAFWRFFSAGRYRVVSWNGRRFDLPVLRLRAMLHGVETAAWYRRGDRWNGYARRFGEDYHADVMQCLSDDGGTLALGLDETSHLLGLPGKVGADGSAVADLVVAGRIGEVRSYCDCDVLGTLALYLRWAHLSGRCTASAHDAAVSDMVRYLDTERAARPHLGLFLDGWDRRYVGSGAADPGLRGRGEPEPIPRYAAGS